MPRLVQPRERLEFPFHEDDRATGRIRHLKRLWLETDLLADGEKPERFRLGRTDNYWSSKGRTKSELNV